MENLQYQNFCQQVVEKNKNELYGFNGYKTNQRMNELMHEQ